MTGGVLDQQQRRPAVAVDELKRAWRAVQAGQFRSHHVPRGARPADAESPAPPASPAGSTAAWSPKEGERVLPVVGCAGAAGASTTALAMALAAEGPARVVECSSVTASGLAAASTAELGRHSTGWTQGTRDQVLLERVSDVLVRVEEIPAPATPDRRVDLTVLDAGWELGQVLATPCWLGEVLGTAPVVVAVTTATVPGFRRLEGALELLGPARVVVAVLGPRRRKWPRGLEHSAGPHTRTVLDSHRVVEVAWDRGLARRGLDSTPLPASLLAAGTRLLRLTSTDTVDTHPDADPDAATCSGSEPGDVPDPIERNPA